MPMRRRLAKLIAPLASLKVTVVLLAMLIFLVFAGTLAQTEMDIWDVMHQYFRSALVFIPVRLFVPRDVHVPVSLPFPGGLTIGALLLVNVLAAHAVRFKVKARGARLASGVALIVAGVASIVWLHNGPLPGAVISRAGGYAGVLPLMIIGSAFYVPMVVGCLLAFGRRAGIVLIHGAIILLLVGEGVTAGTAVETQMPIYEGQTTHWAQDVREAELAIIDDTAPDHDTTVAIPAARLERAARTGERLAHPQLPFTVRVELYFPNAGLTRADASAPLASSATGVARNMMAVRLPKVSTMDNDGRGINIPAAYVTLLGGETVLGTYLVSPDMQVEQYIPFEQRFTAAGRTFRIALRFRRYYKPYALRLDKFNHDLYPGTSVPKNFSSDLRLFEANGVDRDVVIKMNNPMRYAGETFFQSGWIPSTSMDGRDRGTVLSVVRNPGWTIPYIACALGTIGLIVQFGLGLTRFLRKERA